MCAEHRCAQSWANVRRAGPCAELRRPCEAGRAVCATGPTRLLLLKLRARASCVHLQARVEYIALELGEVGVVAGKVPLSCGVVVNNHLVAHEGVCRAEVRALRHRGGERCHSNTQHRHLPEVQQNTSESMKQSGGWGAGARGWRGACGRGARARARGSRGRRYRRRIEGVSSEPMGAVKIPGCSTLYVNSRPM